MRIFALGQSAIYSAVFVAVLSVTSYAEQTDIICKWQQMRMISLYEDASKDLDVTEDTFRTTTYLLQESGDGGGVLIDGDQKWRFVATIDEHWITAVNNIANSGGARLLKINRITGQAESTSRYTPSTINADGLRGRSITFYGKCNRAEKAL